MQTTLCKRKSQKTFARTLQKIQRQIQRYRFDKSEDDNRSLSIQNNKIL